ncbi:MAG: sodium:solute symporter, partial [Rickettsiaceae bacterium]
MGYIDTAIFLAFLFITLFVGIASSRGIRTIKHYALGHRNFSTATIVATIVATWISGSAFMTDIGGVYKDGIFWAIPIFCGDIINWLIICYLLAPRMSEFLGSISIADALGNIYGNKIRFIASISSTFNCIGKIAAQFKVSATVLELFFGVSSFYAILISCIIVILYSSFGGIKAVTFTDIIQFFTFGSILPIIGLIIWGTFDDPHVVYSTVSSNKIFDFSELFNIHNPNAWSAGILFVYFCIPSINPAIFQRISMSRDTNQVSQSFFYAIITCSIIAITFFWIGILLLAKNPSLEPSKLFGYIIDNYAYVGAKGLIAAGVMAMVMSTADSYINAASVTFSYDVSKALNMKWSESFNLKISYLCSILIGILAFVLAFCVQGLFGIFTMVSSFYLPIVTMPLMLAIFGFRSTTKSALIGISAGFTTVLVWRMYGLDKVILSTLPGSLANLTFFIGSHYLLKQEGGWGRISNKQPLMAMKSYRKLVILEYIYAIKNFNFYRFCI